MSWPFEAVIYTCNNNNFLRKSAQNVNLRELHPKAFFFYGWLCTISLTAFIKIHVFGDTYKKKFTTVLIIYNLLEYYYYITAVLFDATFSWNIS